MQIKSIKFWGRILLEYLGLVAGSSLILMLLKAGGFWQKGETGAFVELYPYYLYIVGMILTGVISISFFQVYVPVLLSMNVTRKSIVRGIFFTIGGNAVCMLALMAIVWSISSGDIAKGGRELLPWMAGILFAITALFLMLGAVLIRWGKVGMLITAFIYVVLGAGVGLLFAMSSKDLFGIRLGNFLDFSGWGLASLKTFFVLFPIAAGLLMYLGAGIFVRIVTRKTEVRA